MKNLEKFLELVEDQFSYGGIKYAGSKDKPTRESTDDLFDDFGRNWLFGTMAKYCKRYSNLAKSIPEKGERDLLKIACYCYILWLKRGFFVGANGVDSPAIDTNVPLKQKYFGDFISLISTQEPTKKFLAAIGMYDENLTNPELAYCKLKEFANKDWKQIKEFDIKIVFYLTYLEWNEKYSMLEKHDTDTGQKPNK